MTQFDPIRVGLIGAGGRWGPRAHAPALNGVPETELYAVCTAHADTAQAAADKLGVPRAYGNDKELNADAQVEAVAVAVRVPAHYELTKNAIEAGKHVFCEWPLGANTKEAEDLAALARRKNVRTMVGLQRRASPAYLYMRELLDQGYVGEVLAVNMTLLGSGVLTRPSDRTWQRDVTLGANTLTITLGHVFDAMCMVVGELAELSAMVSTQAPNGSRPTRKNTWTSPHPTTSRFTAAPKTAPSSMPTAAYIRITAAGTGWRFTAGRARWR